LSTIAKSAIIDSGAKIGENVTIGHYSIIEQDVVIGTGTVVENHVLLKAGTKIGENNKICHAALIGGDPQDIKFAGWKSGVEIGDDNIIREFVTVHRATEKDSNTRIGSNCYIMAYVHIAHDCQIGNNVIIANATQMGGFVIIEDFVFLSALVPIHQFCRIGRYSIIGGGYRVVNDVIPYALAGGDPLRIHGLNSIGLRRNNFKKEAVTVLKKAIKFILDKGLNTKQAVEKIQSELPQTDEIKNLLRFIAKSKRGIVRG